ncbi:MAG: HAD-IA family hydrolase [Ornithinimicrobium sp.]
MSSIVGDIGDNASMTVLNRTFAAVLFDNDGTLIDSTPVVRRAWGTWAKEHGVDPDRWQDFHGVPAADIVASLLPDGDQEAALARIVELEESDTEGIRTLPGAAQALSAVAGRGAVVTSATRNLAVARLEAAELPVPEVLISADDISAGKPDPEPYLLGAQRMGVRPQDCLVVEDAPSGVTAGHAAGCAVLSVVTTTAREDLSADHIVPDLSHVRFTLVDDGVVVSAAERD